MKAISLWQPWATLVAVGEKSMETRSWSTRYRGPLLICSSKKKLSTFTILPFLVRGGIGLSDLLYGHALALVDLTHIFKTEEVFADLSVTEKYFGDFSPGRYAWQLENLRRLEEPFPVKGKQGLFTLPGPFPSILR